MASTDYKNKIIRTIEQMDSIFDKIGRELPYTNKNLVLFALGFKSLELSRAIILLCDNSLNDEATILLRSLLEVTIKLRWILNRNTKNRILNNYFQDPQDFAWGKSKTPNMKIMLEELGFQGNYYEQVVGVCHSFSHVNSESIDWDKFSKKNSNFGLTADAIYSIVYQMLGHVSVEFEKHISKEFGFSKQIFAELKQN